MKCRSSSSFTPEVKDFVKPIGTPIDPCKGAINVVKQAKDHNCSGGRHVEQHDEHACRDRRRSFDTSSGRGQLLDLATVTVAQGPAHQARRRRTSPAHRPTSR